MRFLFILGGRGHVFYRTAGARPLLSPPSPQTIFVPRLRISVVFLGKGAERESLSIFPVSTPKEDEKARPLFLLLNLPVRAVC